VSGNHTLRLKSHSAYGNCTLRVEINFMRVEIILVRVGITFVPVKITLRVEIERVGITLDRVEITCQTYSRVCRKLTLSVKSHSACGNLNLRVETNLVRVEITLMHI
jgi:hypothetical protein